MKKFLIALLGLSLLAPQAGASVTIPYSFSAGTTISSSQVNANFSALMNELNAHEALKNGHYTGLSDILAVSNSCGSSAIDFNENYVFNFRVENVSANPAAGNPGRLVYNTGTNALYLDNGSSIVQVASSSFPNWSSVLAGGNSAGAINPDFNENQALRMRLENLSSDPAAGNPGRMWFNTTTNGAKIDTGSAVSSFLSASSTDTLTNKTLSGTSNTFSSIPNSATTAASANTASAIVARDLSGNFSAGTVTANLTGNVTGNLTGNVTGNVTGAVTGNASTATALAATPTGCGANQFSTAIAASGNLTCAQPAFSNLSGSIAASQLPNPSATTLGGIQSLAATTSKWINAISTLGVPSATQPGFSDLSGTASDAQLATSYVKADGTRPLTANWNAGAFTITASTFSGALSGNASTATALAATPTGCGTGTFANGIAANGNLTCGTPAGGGNVTGPLSSTDTAIAIYSGTTGQTIQNSSITIPSAGALSGVTTVFNGANGISVPSVSSADTFVTANAGQTLTAKKYQGVKVNQVAKTGAYTILSSDDVVQGATAGGAFTLTLPSAATAGRIVTITKTDSSANALTVSRGGTDNIVSSSGNTTSTALFAQGETIKLESDGGTSWYYLAGGPDRTIHARVGAGTDQTVCSTGTCTLYRSTGGLTVSFSSTGTYSVTFPSGVFSAAPVCGTINIANGVANGYGQFTTVTSTSTTLATYRPDTNAAINSWFDLICTGAR